ncbi:MAG: type III polyketide synthase [Gemmataceae bacterium]
MAFAIQGIGTAVPPTKLTREESIRIAEALGYATEDHATWLPLMYENTGIKTRHIFFPQEVVQDVIETTTHSGSVFLPTGKLGDQGPTTHQRMEHYAKYAKPLAIKAATRAIERAGISKDRLTHLITVSCTGFEAPGVDIALITELELPPMLERTHVGYMGCHGSLNGLRVANAFTTAGPDACVLLCAVELCSLHYHYGWEPQRLIANALFADGAAAVVGTSGENVSTDTWAVTASGSYVLPHTQDAMTWTVGDHGFCMTLSKKLPELIRTNLKPWLSKWLGRSGLDISNVGSWAVHPGGPAILEAVESGLDLPPNALSYSRDVLARYGNMSSPTVLFVLDRMRTAKAALPCVVLGFGPGLTAEVALVR